MALTQNQLDTYFQSQIGRPATPYEYSQYQGADLQKIANIGNEYKGLNQDQSIVDYLKYRGEDPSIQNRIKLGQQYGITNVGSAEGNVALMKALKGGNPSTPQNAPVQGSVSAAGQSSSSSTPTQGGSVSAATEANTTGINPPPPQTPTDPLEVAKNDYTRIQGQVASIDQQLDDAYRLKKEEVAKAGGVVDESQLRSIVAAEKAPLMSERGQLVRQQATLGKAYQSALAERKISDQESQFAQKQALAGFKLASTTDEYGNKVNYWVKNPGATTGVDGHGNPVSVVKSPGGGTVVKSALTSTSPSTGVTAASTGLEKDPTNGLPVFVSTASAPTSGNGNRVIPGTAGRTEEALFNDAVSAYLGTYKPLGRSTSAPGDKMYSRFISDKAGAFSTKFGPSAAVIGLYKGDTQAAQQQIVRLAKLDTQASVLSSQIPSLAKLAGNLTDSQLRDMQDGIGRKDLSKLSVADFTALKEKWNRQTGSTSAAAYLEQIQTIQSEYAQLQASTAGSQGSQFLSASAQDAIPMGLTPQQYLAIGDQINSNVQKARVATSGVLSSIYSNVPILGAGNQAGPGGTASGGQQSGPSGYAPIPFQVPSGYDYNYQRDLQQAQQAVAGGADPASVWGHFNTLYK